MDNAQLLFKAPIKTLWFQLAAVLFFARIHQFYKKVKIKSI